MQKKISSRIVQPLIVISAAAALTILLSACGINTSSTTSDSVEISTQKIETTTEDVQDKVEKAQESGNPENCKSLPEEHLQKQCEFTIAAEKENAKLNQQ